MNRVLSDRICSGVGGHQVSACSFYHHRGRHVLARAKGRAGNFLQGRAAVDRECTDSGIRFTYVQISGGTVRCQHSIHGIRVQRRDMLPRSDGTGRCVEWKGIHPAFSKRDKELVIIRGHVDFRWISRIERRRFRGWMKRTRYRFNLKFLHTSGN